VEFNKTLDDLETIEVHLEDAGDLVVWCCLEDEEGDVFHLRSDMPSGAVVVWRDVKHST